MKTDPKDESTRDVICIDFGFGHRSYKEEVDNLNKLRKKGIEAEDEERVRVIDELLERVEERKDLFKHLSKDDIRREFYENGLYIDYSIFSPKEKDKDVEVIGTQRIYYKMLYRNPSKAKVGQCMFINEELYDVAYDWLTMGLGSKLPEKEAKIVEISAYAPLTTSAIEGTMTLSLDNVLFVEDQDSFFRTIADVVKCEDYEETVRKYNRKTKKYDSTSVTKKKCVVERKETDVKNTLWDGMALIEADVLPEWCNGMALLRNHFFKSCAFKTHIQQFIFDYCSQHNLNYDTFEVVDMFGNKHLAKNVKMITTNNSLKIFKFTDIMGGTKLSAYEYWKNKVIQNNCLWGIVKTDHPSKLDSVQQMSYQMVNSLPCSEEDIYKIASTSVRYVELLKSDNNEFEKFLRKKATAVNSYEMLADLYDWNHNFEKTKFWKTNKRMIINSYVSNLRQGKITVVGDNLTVCGNPYALLLHTVGEDWSTDPTFKSEDGVIQVYTKRFEDGEYLCGIRNPHNSANNLGYFHNTRHELMERYFAFSKNIMAVNCIHTDVQARLNGEDFDSDFNFVTNQPQMVEAARIAYRDFPTVVNEIAESGIVYNNSKADYAAMDSKLQTAQKSIGGSSDSAQLALSYYFSNINKGINNEDTKQLYDNTVILAVLAQIAIDGCKRLYEVDPADEITRIRSQSCMKRQKDYPAFMVYTHNIPVTKNGKERSYEEIKLDRNKVKKRVDKDIICPMNWLQDCLNKIQGTKIVAGTDVYDLLADKPSGNYNWHQMTKIRKIIEDYDAYVRLHSFPLTVDSIELINIKSAEVLAQISGMTMSKATIYRLIETSICNDARIGPGKHYKKATKYTIKTLNILFKYNKEKFLSCFIKGENEIENI